RKRLDWFICSTGLGSPKRTGLDGHELRIACTMNIRAQLALKQLAHEGHRPVRPYIDDVADERFPKSGGKFRRVVADLVRVGKNDDGWLHCFDELFEGCCVAVRSVLREQRMIERNYLIHRICRGVLSQRVNLC